MSEKESIIDLICQKFSKEKDDINEQLDEHLHSFDLTDEYKTEVTKKFNTKINEIFNIKNGGTFFDFVTNVYGKSNIVSYHELDMEIPGKDQKYNNKQMIYLDGNLNLSDSKFDFLKNDLFTFGNYEQMDQPNYSFTSFKSQNSYLFVKVDPYYAYSVFNSHGDRRLVFRLGTDFFINPVMDCIFDDDTVEAFFENNTDNDVDKLFATVNPAKSYVKELIIYQIDN